MRYHQVRQEMGFFRVLSVMSGSQRRCNEIQKSYYDFIYFSNHSLKLFADLTGAQFKSFRNCHLLYKGRIVIVHTYIRINEITRNTSPNHSYNVKLSFPKPLKNMEFFQDFVGRLLADKWLEILQQICVVRERESVIC